MPVIQRSQRTNDPAVVVWKKSSPNEHLGVTFHRSYLTNSIAIATEYKNKKIYRILQRRNTNFERSLSKIMRYELSRSRINYDVIDDVIAFEN